MSTIQIGVDLAKTVFEVAISSAPGVVSARRRLSRTAFPRFLATQAPAEVLLETCGSAHLGPMRWRCWRQPGTRGLTPAPVRSVEQQAVLALHRIRQVNLRTRTARINALRSHLRKLGHAIPPFLREALVALLVEIRALKEQAETVRTTLMGLARDMTEAQRLPTVPGVGMLTATAMVACVGDIHRVCLGRHFASWLGLTPREHSSGASRRLGAITRKGNSFLRMLADPRHTVRATGRRGLGAPG